MFGFQTWGPCKGIIGPNPPDVVLTVPEQKKREINSKQCLNRKKGNALLASQSTYRWKIKFQEKWPESLYHQDSDTSFVMFKISLLLSIQWQVP
jgi:hypothetical protein